MLKKSQVLEITMIISLLSILLYVMEVTGPDSIREVNIQVCEYRQRICVNYLVVIYHNYDLPWFVSMHLNNKNYNTLKH